MRRRRRIRKSRTVIGITFVILPHIFIADHHSTKIAHFRLFISILEGEAILSVQEKNRIVKAYRMCGGRDPRIVNLELVGGE
jgi:hypothetical protein